MNEHVTIRRIPLAPLYRRKLLLSLECGACGARFMLDHRASGWKGRRGTCPACGKPQRLRPADLRRVLEKSFRRAAWRCENRNGSRLWSEALAFTIARAAVSLEPVLMVAVAHLRAQRIGHYIQNTMGLIWGLADKGYGEALLFAMPPNPKTESNSYFRNQIANRFVLTAAAIPAYHLLEKEPTFGERLLQKWRNFRIRSKRMVEKSILLAEWGRAKPSGHTAELAGEFSNEAQWAFTYYVTPESMSSFIAFTPQEHDRAKTWFEEHGLDPSAPYVCFNARDINYLNMVSPGGNWSYHSFRDMDVDTFIPAMNWLADRGITCFRMGKHPGKRLSLRRPGVVDYAATCQDDFMDVYLHCHCLYGVSSGTGSDQLFLLSGKWYLNVNMVWPYVPSNLYCAANCWAIMKKFWSHDRRRFLSLREIYKAKADYAVMTSELNARGVSVLENTPDEILAAVQEVFARRAGNWVPEDGEEKVKPYVAKVLEESFPKFKRKIKNNLNFCTSFLRSNPHFLAGSGIQFDKGKQ